MFLRWYRRFCRLARSLAESGAGVRWWGWLAPGRQWRRLRGRTLPFRGFKRARAILVIRPDELGDVLLTTPFLRELRAAAPEAHITLVVKRTCRPLVSGCPHVDQVVTYDWECVEHASPLREMRLRIAALQTRFGALRGARFDLVLLPRRDADLYGAEYLAHLCASHGPIVANRGMRTNGSVRSPCNGILPDVIISNSEIEHEVDHALRFLRLLGAPVRDGNPDLWLSVEDRSNARKWLAGRLPCKAPLIVIHPSGGRSKLKQWPVEKFRALLPALKTMGEHEFLVVGGPGETWILEAFARFVGPTVAVEVGTLPVRQLAAVLATAGLFVGCDSGPMHLAAAAGTQVVAIFGSTSVKRFAPRGSRSRVVSLELPCSPDQLGTFENRCQRCVFPEPHCLTELPVERVLAAIQSVMPLAKPPPAH